MRSPTPTSSASALKRSSGPRSRARPCRRRGTRASGYFDLSSAGRADEHFLAFPLPLQPADDTRGPTPGPGRIVRAPRVFRLRPRAAELRGRQAVVDDPHLGPRSLAELAADRLRHRDDRVGHHEHQPLVARPQPRELEEELAHVPDVRAAQQFRGEGRRDGHAAVGVHDVGAETGDRPASARSPTAETWPAARSDCAASASCCDR